MSDGTTKVRAYTQDDHVRSAASNLVHIYGLLDTHNRTELPEKLVTAIEWLAEALEQPRENLLSDSSEPEKAARDAVVQAIVQAAVWYVEAREAPPDEALIPGTFILRAEHSYDHLQNVVLEFKARGGS
jgi:hypothetical protein